MSLKKVEQVKKDRFFRIWDILVYGVIIVVVVALFLAVTLTADKSSLTAISAYYDNGVAFSYDFEKGELNIAMPDNVKVEDNGENTLTIIFCTNGGSLDKPESYNTIVIDKAERTVSVTESDCSNRKDCVHTPALKDSSSLIVCSPHHLRILPDDYRDDGQTLPVG